MAQHFLPSAAARSLSPGKVMRMSDRGAENVFVRLRWPQTDGKPVCPQCGCRICYDCRRSEHQARWRCKACRADFSATSGTLFAWHKLPLRTYLMAIAIFCNEVKGKRPHVRFRPEKPGREESFSRRGGVRFVAEMQNLASPLDSDWLNIRSRLPPDLDLNQLARDTSAIQRMRGITDAEDLLRLGLARGPGGKTLKQTSAWAYMSGIAELSAPSLSDRLHQSVGFFAALTGRLLQVGRSAKPAVWRGRCMHLCDASTLSQPGSKGTDWRIHATYDLGSGGFSHLELTDGQGAEALTRAVCDDGGVMIADRGYAKAGEMAAFRTGSGGRPRDFIVRTGWNMLRLESPDGTPFDLIGALRQMEQAPLPDPLNEPREWTVEALYGRGKKTKRLPIRLMILPLPPDKPEIARKKVRRSANKRQYKTDARSDLAAGFMMLATSLPPDIPADEICAVYRLRWQIELAFKRLKSLIRIDRLPTRTEAGSLSWLYPHLILALLTDDICQEILESPPSGPRLRYWCAFNMVDPGRRR